MADEQLQAAIERLNTWLRDLADKDWDGSRPLAHTLSVRVGVELDPQDKSDILCGRIRRQLEAWGWKIMQESGNDNTLVLVYSDEVGQNIWLHDTPLDCYLDALTRICRDKGG